MLCHKLQIYCYENLLNKDTPTTWAISVVPTVSKFKSSTVFLNSKLCNPKNFQFTKWNACKNFMPYGIYHYALFCLQGVFRIPLLLEVHPGCSQSVLEERLQGNLLFLAANKIQTGVLLLNPFTPRVSCGDISDDSNFWVCGRNPMMWPFKWNLFSSTFTWCYLYFSILQN